MDMITKDIYYTLEEEDNKTCISVFHDEIQIGKAFFSYGTKDRNVWLYYIGVEPEYRRMKLGTVLLSLVENEARARRYSYIEGKFYPKGIGQEELTAFYARNGYTRYVDGYEKFVGKYLSTTNKITPPFEIEQKGIGSKSVEDEKTRAS